MHSMSSAGRSKRGKPGTAAAAAGSSKRRKPRSFRPAAASPRKGRGGSGKGGIKKERKGGIKKEPGRGKNETAVDLAVEMLASAHHLDDPDHYDQVHGAFENDPCDSGSNLMKGFGTPNIKDKGTGDASRDARVGNAYVVDGLRRIRSVPLTSL